MIMIHTLVKQLISIKCKEDVLLSSDKHFTNKVVTLQLEESNLVRQEGLSFLTHQHIKVPSTVV